MAKVNLIVEMMTEQILAALYAHADDEHRPWVFATQRVVGTDPRRADRSVDLPRRARRSGAARFASQVRDFCNRTIDIGAGLKGLTNPFKSAGKTPSESSATTATAAVSEAGGRRRFSGIPN